MAATEQSIEGCDDLLIKILLLLPARPLVRFKLVSKRWFSIISDHSFSSLWKPEASPSGLLIGKGCYIPLKDKTRIHGVVDFVQVPPGYVVEISKSCGGLLLCRSKRGLIIDIGEYYVCNPTTKQFATIPRPNLPPLDMSLAFDHSISPHYKVINLSRDFQIEVYTSQTNSWKQVSAQFPQPRQGRWLFHKGVFFNGAIFWIFHQLDSFYYFNIDTEIVHSCPMPPTMRIEFVGSVKEHLYLVGSSGSTERPGFDMFELRSDNSSWCLKCHIDPYEVAIALLEMGEGPVGQEKGSFLQYNFLTVMARQGNEGPYLAVCTRGSIFMVSLIDCTCSKLLTDSTCHELFELPWQTSNRKPLYNFIKCVHHVIENPFWVGSKVE